MLLLISVAPSFLTSTLFSITVTYHIPSRTGADWGRDTQSAPSPCSFIQSRGEHPPAPTHTLWDLAV